MIINKYNKGYQTRSDMPNSNWLDDNWFVVSDNSDLADKIERLYPRFEFILDENDELVDVVEAPKTQEDIKAERVNEIHLVLQELDKTINRATEDLYEQTNIIPYTTVQEVIEQKEKLRIELQELTEVRR